MQVKLDRAHRLQSQGGPIQILQIGTFAEGRGAAVAIRSEWPSSREDQAKTLMLALGMYGPLIRGLLAGMKFGRSTFSVLLLEAGSFLETDRRVVFALEQILCMPDPLADLVFVSCSTTDGWELAHGLGQNSPGFWLPEPLSIEQVLRFAK